MSSKKKKETGVAAAAGTGLQQWLSERLGALGREVAGVAEQMRRVERKVDRVEEKMKEFHENLDEERDVMDEQYDKLRSGIEQFSDRVDKQFAVGDDLCSQIVKCYNEQHMRQEVIIEFLRNEMMLDGARSTMGRMKSDMGEMKCDMGRMRDEWAECRRELSGCGEAVTGMTAGVAGMVESGQRMEVVMRDSVRAAVGDEMRESDERWKGMIRDVKGRLDGVQRELRAGLRGQLGRGQDERGETVSDICSAAATERAAHDGAKLGEKHEGVYGGQHGGRAQYFAGPPTQ